MFTHERPLLWCGLLAWFGGTAILRMVGQHLLPLTGAETLLLLTLSIPSSAWLARGLCRAFQLERDRWSAASLALVLPTLLFDGFSTAYFPTVFPNIDPSAAGAFGGWMLSCCAGAVLGGIGRSDTIA